MTPVEILAGVAGVLALGYPYAAPAFSWATGLWQGLGKPPLPKPQEEAVAPSYIDAMNDLASVRNRLKETSFLKDEQSKAINTLTLALVAGSDL